MKISIITVTYNSEKTIANTIGWSVLCLLSAVYISHRKKLWMWIVWVIAVVMIIMGIIL